MKTKETGRGTGLFVWPLFVLLLLTGPQRIWAEDSTTEEGTRWTILFYGHGDHSLSASLADDLLKFEVVGSTDEFRIVGQVDFDASQEEDNTEAGLPPKLSKGVTRFLFNESKDPERVTSRPVQRLPEQNMDDPDVLEDFLSWGIRAYPADRYGVVLWDHGGQWEGFGGDTQDGTEDGNGTLYPAQIAETVRKVLDDQKIGKLDFFGFDTCLMGGLEVLDSFPDLCEFFFACPEIDYGDGWNYAESLAWLKDNPDADLNDFAHMEVASWKKLHMEKDKNNDLILAAHVAYDMSRYPQVRNAFETFVKTLAAECSPDNLILPKMRRLAPEYGVSSPDGRGDPTHYIDLGGFAKGFAGSSDVSSELNQVSSNLVTAIDDMIVAKTLGNDKVEASGLSIWYPVFPSLDSSDSSEEDDSEETDDSADDDSDDSDDDSDGDDSDDDSDEDTDEDSDDDTDEDDSDDDTDEADDSGNEYEEEKEAILDKFETYRQIGLFRHSPWPEYLKTVWQARENFEQDNVIKIPHGVQHKLSTDEEFKTTLTVKEGPGTFLLHGSLYDIRHRDKKRYTCLGEVLTAGMDGTGRYEVKWKPVLPALKGEEDKPVAIGIYPKSASGEIWTAYAQYQSKPGSKPFDVVLVIQMQEGSGRLLNILRDESEFSPTTVRVRAGALITPIFLTEVRDGNDPDQWDLLATRSAKSVTVPQAGLSGLDMEFLPLPSGHYELELLTEDVDGYVSNTETVPLEVSSKP